MRSFLNPVTSFSIKKEHFFLNKFIQTLSNEMIPIEIIDRNGKKYTTNHKTIKHRLFIKDSKFFKALVSPDAFSLGEAYVKGYFDISGSIKELYELVCDKFLHTSQRKSVYDIFSSFFIKATEKEKKNVEYHYDVPSNFYRLFLGKTMGYTCGYYANEKATVDDAQNEKMDIVCRKLRLQKGERVLDIGCGWGNFAVYAAKHYDVHVTGITLSTEQKKYADLWIEKERLKDKIKISILNYRDLGKEAFHKISCVGMSEHVGIANMKTFFKKVYNSLVPNGLFLQHTITTNEKPKKGYENSFLNRYMFPGGELMQEKDLMHVAALSGFELLGAENLRVHYIKTLSDWIAKMESKKDKLVNIVSDNVYRIYHIFFIGSLISFRQKEISLFQNLFYKSDTDQNPIDFFTSPYSVNEQRIF
ncbi:MAG: class I SAM-dependent methyltransferase [Desulfobacteraceae bacterium]|nr:class I SAM-dependent methyltransferase [Desulfobacteraceae bacterium]